MGVNKDIIHVAFPSVSELVPGRGWFA